MYSNRDGCQDATTATSPEYQEIDGITNGIRPWMLNGQLSYDCTVNTRIVSSVKIKLRLDQASNYC
jgi:hypothetical protein